MTAGKIPAFCGSSMHFRNIPWASSEDGAPGAPAISPHPTMRVMAMAVKNTGGTALGRQYQNIVPACGFQEHVEMSRFHRFSHAFYSIERLGIAFNVKSDRYPFINL